MDLHIGSLVSTIHAVDGDTLLSPPTLERIVRAVLQALDERDAHRARVRAEQRISPGVRHELEGEEE
jgi:hypothetical protein